MYEAVSVVQTGAAFEPVGDMFNLYQYNTRSEVVDAVRYFGSNTNDTSNPVGLQDQASHSFARTCWSYAYDPPSRRLWRTGNIPHRQRMLDFAGQVGNRSGTMSASGGSACGGKANAAGNYTVNALNQYTERTVHGVGVQRVLKGVLEDKTEGIPVH